MMVDLPHFPGFQLQCDVLMGLIKRKKTKGRLAPLHHAKHLKLLIFLGLHMRISHQDPSAILTCWSMQSAVKSVSEIHYATNAQKRPWTIRGFGGFSSYTVPLLLPVILVASDKIHTHFTHTPATFGKVQELHCVHQHEELIYSACCGFWNFPSPPRGVEVIRLMCPLLDEFNCSSLCKMIVNFGDCVYICVNRSTHSPRQPSLCAVSNVASRVQKVGGFF